MSKKNLLELCLSPDLGGLELYMVRCAKALEEDMNVISVINAEGKLEQYYKDTPYRYEAIKRKSGMGAYGTAKKLARIIDENKTEIIHAHWTKDLLTAVLAKKLSTHKPRIVQTRNMTMTRFKDDVYHRWLYKNISLMLPVTYQVKEQLEHFIPQKVRPKIEVLYMGSDKPELLNDEEVKELKDKLGFDLESFNVGMVGRINEAKGQHLLIKAVELLVKKGLSVNAYFVGHPMKESYLEELKHDVKSRGIEQNIHFLGFMKNPHHFYQICDAVVLASMRETFGLVLIEAMQVGTAVIGSNSGGVVEIIDDEKTGLLFENQNYEDLAKKIEMLVGDIHLKENLAKAGQEKCQEKFSNEKQFVKLKSILEEMV
ncbi:glycosyltransferase family 4 protein [Sulfurimonas sp. HSL-1716]|uniref:glycosyltransferase family 4 protein n=1 Tax=Hydrocurvibacter sulfurireducens TaxID=3131937 RepID=UPI0031FA414C